MARARQVHTHLDEDQALPHGDVSLHLGRHFGRRSHSTVLAAEKTVRKWMTSQSSIVLADATWDVDQAIRRVEDVLRAG